MKHILTLLISMFAIISHAQQMVPTDIPTPNASDLGRYGNTPISYYTGAPDISIPIYEMRVKDAVLPISLRHDATGVLMNTLPGWTGHNWTLLAGGAITRVRQNMYDEEMPSTKTVSNYFSQYAQMKYNWNNNDFLKNYSVQAYNDYQPDIFHFTFLGKTGRFFLGNDGQWKVCCDENIDVVFDINNQDNYISPFIDNYININNQTTLPPKVIKGFILRDSNGYIYEFGGNNDAIDYTTPFFSQALKDEFNSLQASEEESFHASTWYLTSIKDKYGNELFNLQYERGKFIAQFYNFNEEIELIEHTVAEDIQTGVHNQTGNSDFPYNGALNSPVYLKQINAADGEVVKFISEDSPISSPDLYPRLNIFGYTNNIYNTPFYYLQTEDSKIAKYQYNPSNTSKRYQPLMATRMRELKEIHIDAGDNFALNIVNLSYDYNKRIHLTDIAFTNYKKTVPYGHYHFDYNGYSYLPEDYLTLKTDHWGYYNGNDYHIGDLDARQKKETEPGVALYGLLTRITYPTGGCTELEYESNHFSSCTSPDRQTMQDKYGYAGGVRIKRITDYSDIAHTELLSQRCFSYNDPNTGKDSGQLFAEPRYSWNNWMCGLEYGDIAVAQLSIFRLSSIVPLSNAFGPHIGYSCVTETNEDGTQNTFRYLNISDSKDERFIKDFSNGEPSPYDIFSDRGYKRGKPMSIEQYDSSGNLVKHVKYGYAKDSIIVDSVLASNIDFHPGQASVVFNYYSGGIYKLLVPKYDIIADTTVYKYNTGNIVDCRTYKKENSYLTLQQPYSHKQHVRYIRSESLDRCGLMRKTTYEYPFDRYDNASYKLWAYQFDLNSTKVKNYNGNTFIGGYDIRHRLDYRQNPVSDSYIRINHDNTTDTIVWYKEYTDKYALRLYKERGKPLTEIIWNSNDTHIFKIRKGVDMQGLDRPEETVYYLDRAEMLNEVDYPDGNVIYYTYDGMNRLIEVQDRLFRPVVKYQYRIKNSQ